MRNDPDHRGRSSRYRAFAVAALLAAAVAVAALLPATGGAADPAVPTTPPSGMRLGSPALQSIGALTFGTDGTLFLGDNLGSTVYAVHLEVEATESGRAVDVDGIDRRIASLLGTRPNQIRIHDIAVRPNSGEIYVSVSRGAAVDGVGHMKGVSDAGRTPHLIRLRPGGDVEEVVLEDVSYSELSLRDVRSAGTNRWGDDNRTANILELAFADGELWISGMSTDAWSSRLRRASFPFEGQVHSSGLRIFHTAHGRYETTAPARVFVPYLDDGEAHVFAGFSCTPLVDFSVEDLRERDEAHGKTIAELGAGNHVLDMIAVEHGGETYFLLANHLHPFMVLALSDFDGAAELARPMGRGGIERRTIDGPRVVRLAAYGGDQVLLLQENGDAFDLRSMPIAEIID